MLKIQYIKRKVVPLRALKAYRGSEGIAPHIFKFNLGLRSVFNFPLLSLQSLQKKPVLTKYENVWTGRDVIENSKSPILTGIGNLEHPARSPVTRRITSLRLTKYVTAL